MHRLVDILSRRLKTPLLARLLAALLFLAAALPAAAQNPLPPLDGRYFGIDAAEGVRLEIRPSAGGFAGRLTDRSGAGRDFEAEGSGGGAEWVMELDNRTVLIRLEPLPFGAEAAVVPVGPEGTLDTEAMRIFAFLHEDQSLPDPPAGFIPPPGPGTRRVDAHGFLSSYQFWSPTSVRTGYAALAPRHKTLIRLFPTVQLDVIWKLCLAPDAAAEQGTALRGQGVNCAEVREVIAATQAEGRFDAYKADVDEELGVLRQAIRCGDNFVESKTACDQAAIEVSRKATSLETAATVLSRYR